MRRVTDLAPVVLLALLLTGCVDEQKLVRIAMLSAPFCYLVALIPLFGLRAFWQWRAPDAPLRPRILLIPWLVLLVAAGLGLGAAVRDGENIILGALLLSPVILTVVGLALCVPLLIVWRLWFAIAPQGSFEGAACWVTLLFFAPGMGALFNLVRPDGAFMHFLAEVCTYLTGFSGPLIIILMIEAAWMRSQATKQS